MDIIHEGKPPEKKKYKGECNRCGTVIRFLQSEATFVPDFRDGDYLEIQCPICKGPITVALSSAN